MSASDGQILGLTKILDGGPPGDRFNIVIVAEGFTGANAAAQTAFNDICGEVVQRFQDEPFFRELVPALNVYRLNVRSNDAGADDPANCGDGSAPTPLTTVATYFDATFCGDGGVRRCLTADWDLVRSTLDSQLPAWHVGVVLVDTTKVGGCASGNVFAASMTNDVVDIVMHELGHAAFDLADEYSSRAGCSSGETGHDNAPAGEPLEPNITAVGTLGGLKWASRVDVSTPVPTMTNPNCSACDLRPTPLPDNLTIGLFEGAGYYHCGYYRPAYLCRMRDHSHFFCRVCIDAVIGKLDEFFGTTPALAASIVELDFGGLGQGATATATFEIVNVGTVPVTGIAVATTNAAFVAMLVGSGASLAPAASRTVRVTLGPVMVNGAVSGNLAVTSNASTITIPLSGNICTHTPDGAVVSPDGGMTLNFGSVARGLTMYRSIEVRNTRNSCPAELNVTLSMPAAPFGYAPGTPLSFTLPTPPPYSPSSSEAPSTRRKVYVAFSAPTTGPVGPVNGTLTVAWTGSTFPRTVSLNATVVDPPPVDSVLVLDRSGSMSEATGVPDHDKADLALQAARLYIDLLKSNDRIGLVRFNDRASVSDDVLSTLVVAGNVDDPAAARFTVRDQLTRSNFNPDGATSIGGGTILGSTVLDAASATARAIVVLTDGIQNTAPDIPTARTTVAGKSPRQRVFAVGLGLNQLEDSLVDLSSVTNGYAQITGALVDQREFLLQKLYVQILSDAGDEAFVRDPVETLAPGVQRATDIFIGETDVAADFIVVFRRTDIQPKYAVVWLEAPDGTIIRPVDAGTVFPNVRYFDGFTHRYFRALFPAFPAASRAHVGRWRVWVRNHVNPAPLVKAMAFAVAGHAGEILRYSVLCKARSDLRLGGYLVQNSYGPGSPIGVVLEPTLYGLPVRLEAPVEVRVERPDGSQRLLVLTRGSDERYRAELHETEVVGPYHFIADVAATTPANARVTRYRHMTGIIFRPNRQPPDRPGGGGGDGPNGGGGPNDHRKANCRRAFRILGELTAVLARTPPESSAERVRLSAAIEELARFLRQCGCCG
jgi:hypothetical protein